MQTGKLLHNSRKGAPASVQQANIKSQAKIVASHNRFHIALDDLEEQIVKSKSVLMRDLEQLRAERQQPVQPAAPMVVDEPEELKVEEPTPPAAPVPDMDGGGHEASNLSSDVAAPFPNMGLDVPMDFQPDGSVKEEKLSPQPATAQPAQPAQPSIDSLEQEAKADPTPQVSAPAAPGSSFNDAFDLTGSATMSNDELNFTDMMFSLAPSSDSQAQGQSQNQSHDLDLTNFGNADNLLSLDGLDTGLATNTIGGTGTAADAAPVAQMDLPQLDMAGDLSGAAAAKKPEKVTETSLDDFFNLDGNTSMDNIDLDLDLDGAGDNTNFDDLFFAGDDTDMGGLGDADAYFGL